MNKLCISLLLCTSMCIVQVKADDILKAINNLNIPQVEQEIKEHGRLEQVHKLGLIDAIEERIAQLKTEQSSLLRYLNPQLALGTLAIGIAARYFNKITSNLPIKITNTTYQGRRIVTYTTDTFQLGLKVGALSGLAAIGIKYLYYGLTIKKLKDDYKKALTIKTLIQQAPTE